MEIEVMRFDCSHCEISVLIYKGEDVTSVICNKCGRWMGFQHKTTLQAKVHGKYAGDEAIKIEEV